MSRSALLAAAALAAGCADRRQLVPPAADPPAYRVGCGDLLAVRVAGRPALDGTGCVAADGTLPLGPLGAVPADARTLADIRQATATAAGVPAEAVSVDLVAPQAAVLYLRSCGRLTRLPYTGAESVAGFLRRAGFAVVGPVSVSRPTGDRPCSFAVPVLDAVTVEPGDTVTVHPSTRR